MKQAARTPTYITVFVLEERNGKGRGGVFTPLSKRGTTLPHFYISLANTFAAIAKLLLQGRRKVIK